MKTTETFREWCWLGGVLVVVSVYALTIPSFFPFPLSVLIAFVGGGSIGWAGAKLYKRFYPEETEGENPQAEDEN